MKQVIWLRIYQGTEILKKENGEIKNENSKVSLTHNTLEWSLFLKSLPANPFCKVDVEKVFELKDNKYISVDISKELVEEVLLAHKGDQTVKLTPEQKRIADLEAKIDALLNKDSLDTELDDLKLAYKEQEGKNVPNNKKNDKEWIKNKLTK